MSHQKKINIIMIMKAATEIANNNGVESVTMSSLARKLNVRSPSLYNHVKGISDIQRSLSRHGFEKLITMISNAVTGKKDEEIIRAVSEAFLKFVQDHPGLYQAILYAESNGGNEVESLDSFILNLISRALVSNGLKWEEAFHYAHGYRFILQGFASIFINGKRLNSFNLDISLQMIIDSFLIGIENIKLKNTYWSNSNNRYKCVGVDI